jgi:hypothetical protein
MAESPGIELQRAIRQQAVAVLGRLRDDLEAAGTLTTLGPGGPEWAGTALEGHVLADLGQVGLADPFTAGVLNALRQVTGGAAGGVLTGLHGWEAAPGAARGVAFVARVDTGAGGLAVAVHLTPADGGPLLGLTASGASDEAVRAVLGAEWSIAVSGRVVSALRLHVGPDGSASVVDGSDGDTVRVELDRAADPEPLGVPGGPSLTLGPASLGGEVRVAAGGVARNAWVRLPEGSVQLVPTGLARVVPELGSLPLRLDIGFSGDAGMTLGGSTDLRARVPAAASVPGVELGGLDVTLRAGAAAGSALELVLGVRAAVRVTIPGAPVGLQFEGIGVDAPFVFGDGPGRGVDPSRVVGVRPGGAGVDVALPLVGAGGFVAERRPGEYAGALAASIPPMSASAFGVLAVDPFSFVVVLGATFPPPGIQVGFGFAVSGIGGIVGVNRRVDREALLRAVADGTAAALLFPTDPAGAAASVGGALPALFPPARGGIVAGPMFQMSWGGRLATASVAVLAEVAPKPRVTIIGKLVIGLPDPEAALVLIQVTFAGLVDVTEPSVLVVASMHGSHILGLPVTGDVCLLTRGGDDATFVLSAGGLHPAFPVPRGMPPLARIGMDLSPIPLLELRAEAYFAVTTNSVQFGARVELVAEVAGCGLRGHLGLDVLVQIEPFRFVAEVSIGIALTVFGEELVGIALDLTLEGPANWRAHGRGSIDLFLFSASFDFDEQWGSAPPLPRVPADVGAELAKALAAPDAWVVHRSTTGLPGIVLTPGADRKLGHGELVDPYGALTVHQRRVPLGLAIDRFDRIPLPAKQTWDVVEGRLGDRPAPSQAEVRERFAAAQFLSLTDDQQLARPSYEPFRAGLDLVAAGVVTDQLTPHTIGFETKVIADAIAPAVTVELAVPLSTEVLAAAAAAADVFDPVWWPPPTEVVALSPETPLTIAAAWSLAEIPTPAGATSAELFASIEASGRRDLMVVEAWETSG